MILPIEVEFSCVVCLYTFSAVTWKVRSLARE